MDADFWTLPGRTHCDDAIDDAHWPEVLRAFLRFARAPATRQLGSEKPECWADYRGEAVRICMASRLGDVGINTTGAAYGYSKRVLIDELSNFRPSKTHSPASAQAPTGDAGEGQ